MLFNFQLRKIADIQPFGAEQPELHWFGLTDGWYWLELGNAEAFRYTEAIIDHWGADPDMPYIDYYVVRLWEDLLEMLPYVLHPLDERVASLIADLDEWQRWRTRAEAWLNSLPEDEEDEAWATYLQATGWWGVRRMDTSYLETAPDLWMWRIGDTVTVRWGSRGATMDDIPVWACQQAELTLSAEDFEENVRTFNRMLFNDMKFRVKGAMKSWKRKDVELDTDQLAAEHQERATWLSRALATEPTDFIDDWDRIMQAVTELNATIG
jgi:hypothetical protein